MDINIKHFEFGLKLFYQLENENKNINSPEITTILNTQFHLKPLLTTLEKDEKTSISPEKLSKSTQLLDQYYRQHFIKEYNRSQFKEHLFSITPVDYDTLIKDELDYCDKTNSLEYYQFLYEQNRVISRLKKHNRYNDLATADLIAGITPESLKNQNIQKFISSYFLVFFTYLYFMFHIRIKFGSRLAFETEDHFEKIKEPIPNILVKDTLINNSNIFGLPKKISYPLHYLQSEILAQVKGKIINSESDYLNAKIDLTKQHFPVKSFSIIPNSIEELGLHFNKSFLSKTPCFMVLENLQLKLLEEYREGNHKNILTFSKYKKQYQNFLSEYLKLNIDTDEQDFISSELKLCALLITELDNTIYNTFEVTGTIINEPCLFKKDLSNSIDKRQKHLKNIVIDESTPLIKELVSQQINTTDAKSKTHTKKLSLTQIALKFVYEGGIINRENGNKIANDYGHTSGESLYQKFIKFSNTTDRKAIPNPLTQVKLRNKIELFESVLGLLVPQYHDRIKDEIKILKDHYSNEYQT